MHTGLPSLPLMPNFLNVALFECHLMPGWSYSDYSSGNILYFLRMWTQLGQPTEWAFLSDIEYMQSLMTLQSHRKLSDFISKWTGNTLIMICVVSIKHRIVHRSRDGCYILTDILHRYMQVVKVCFRRSDFGHMTNATRSHIDIRYYRNTSIT